MNPKLVAKKTPLCVFVPGTARSKWKYGFSLEDVWDGMKKGCVLFDGGHLNALSFNDVVKAAARLRDTTTSNKAFDKNVYITGYTTKIKRRLELAWDEFFAKPLDEREHLLKVATEEFGATRKKKPLVKDPTSTTPAPPVQHPKKGRSKWKMNTQVATNKTISPGGIASPATSISLSPDVWVTGLITKYDGEAACPYEIKWDTQPLPILHRKSAVEVAQLVANFQHCTTLRLLRGYVGLDLLWVLNPVTVQDPASGKLGKPHLKYGLVRPFDPIMNKYKITFRSGIWS